eukprot:scaffold273088_cov17-Prasinocladus_malaysianus.AAC.1
MPSASHSVKRRCACVTSHIPARTKISSLALLILVKSGNIAKCDGLLRGSYIIRTYSRTESHRKQGVRTVRVPMRPQWQSRNQVAQSSQMPFLSLRCMRKSLGHSQQCGPKQPCY